LDFSPNSGLEVTEDFTSVIEIPDAKAILDLKIANLNMNQNIVLAVTESSLYQFSGENMLRIMLQECNKNSQNILKNQLTLEASIPSVDQAR
jgi:hypothetical protein